MLCPIRGFRDASTEIVNVAGMTMLSIRSHKVRQLPSCRTRGGWCWWDGWWFCLSGRGSSPSAHSLAMFPHVYLIGFPCAFPCPHNNHNTHNTHDTHTTPTLTLTPTTCPHFLDIRPCRRRRAAQSAGGECDGDAGREPSHHPHLAGTRYCAGRSLHLRGTPTSPCRSFSHFF